MKRVLGVLVSAVVWSGTASADAVTVSIDKLNSGNPLDIQSITIGLNNFSIFKNVDSVSPEIFDAIATGKHLGSANVMLYNGAAVGTPDAQLSLSGVLGVSSVLNSGGIFPTETDTFLAMTPDPVYLELSGVTGMLAIESLTLDAKGFSVVRKVDSASQIIAMDASLGTHLPSATLLFSPSGPEWDFTSVLVSEYQLLAGGVSPEEQDSFVFGNVTQPAQVVPEPRMLPILLAGVALMSIMRKRIC
jgi:type VI protein secretion system component Hcp